MLTNVRILQSPTQYRGDNLTKVDFSNVMYIRSYIVVKLTLIGLKTGR